MSAKVLRKIWPSDPAMWPASQGYFQSLIPRPALWKAKFIDPMFSEHSSGPACNG